MYCIENILNLENYNFFVKETPLDNELRLVKYVKSKCPPNKFNTFGRLRSVILDKDNNCLMFSPPKAMPSTLFMNKFAFDTCSVEDFIEGTMVNVFWNTYKQDWDITTKSIYGATTSFVLNGKLFNEMFYECIAYTKLDISKLDKNVTWSFVMQHPENRIVNNILNPALFLVECYKTGASKPNKSPVEKITNIKLKYEDLFTDTLVQFVDENKYNAYKSYTDILTLFLHTIKEPTEPVNLNSLVAGVVIKSSTGERCKINNPYYEHIHNLRGNTSNKLMRFLELNSHDKVDEYLKYFPEDTSTFKRKMNMLTGLTLDMYDTYIKCFVKKEIKFNSLSPEVKPIIWNIHELYKVKRGPNKHYKISETSVYHVITKIVNKFVVMKVLLNYKEEQLN